VNTTLLVLSELVGNAVSHGEPPVFAEVCIAAGTVMVDVRDAARVPIPLCGRAPTDDCDGGRGLLLVHLECGRPVEVRFSASGKRVRARLDIPEESVVDGLRICAELSGSSCVARGMR